MNSLNIIRVIVSPGAAHATRTDMVRHDIAVISELCPAKGTCAVLGDYLSIEQVPHFRIRAEFAISPGVLGILDSPNAQLPWCSPFRDRFPAAAG
jgi:hypothetical protein